MIEKLVRCRREHTVLLLTYLTSYSERLLINTLNQGHEGGFAGSPKIKYNVITRRIAIERSSLLDTGHGYLERGALITELNNRGLSRILIQASRSQRTE